MSAYGMLVNLYSYIPQSTPQEPVFISRWNTTFTDEGSSNDHQIQLPLVSDGNYDFIIDWGDGNSDHITTWNQAETLHTYASGNPYTLTITGTCEGWQFNGGGDHLKITDILQWGIAFRWIRGSSFFGCANLTTLSATDAPNLTGASFDAMFFNCTQLVSLGPASSKWKTQNITSFNAMFIHCLLFNDPGISHWSFVSATTLNGFMSGCSAFNQPLTINAPNCNNFASMLSGCTAFNSTLTLNTPSATNMQQILYQCSSFNKPFVADTSNVTSMNNAFRGCTQFNQPLTLNLSKCIDLQFMLGFCTNFNSALNLTLSTTDPFVMTGILFGCSSFNHPSVSSWNVSVCFNFDSAFQGCSVFNQPLPWTLFTDTETYGVSCYQMFWHATAFNQDLSGWNVIAGYEFGGFLTGTAFSTANYDLLLISWSAQDVFPNVEFDTDAKYTAGGAAEAGRNTLTGTDMWAISDGGPA